MLAMIIKCLISTQMLMQLIVCTLKKLYVIKLVYFKLTPA